MPGVAAVAATKQPMPSSRRLPAFTRALVSATALLLCSCGGANSQSPPGGGGVGEFASYAWQGAAVRSVHAAWRVPEVEAGSPRGTAATWIGASAEGGVFIQVGTQEECVTPSQGPLPLEDNYFAFWSDTSRGYHPQFLYRVRAGDLIEATLAIGRRRWRLTIVDSTTDTHASFVTDEETQRQPFIAEWAQEDVQVGDAYSAYPRLNKVRLGDVLVNGRPPGIKDLTSSTMSVGEEFQAPSALDDDSFEIRKEAD